jgi:hypothetical protein
MVNFFIWGLDLIAVLLQLFASYFAFRIYSFNRLSKWWLALVFAFLIQAVRRAIQLYVDFGVGNTNVFLDRVMMFIISLLMVAGLLAMLKNFENFDVVAEKVRGKFPRRK